MAVGNLGAEVLELVPDSCAPSEVVNDAQSEWVAANAGQMFLEQIGGSRDIAGGRGADHFNVMALPAHQAATGWTWACLGHGGEIGDSEPEVRIGDDRMTERLHYDGRVPGLLCSAVAAGGLSVGRDHPTVVFDRRTGRCRLAKAGVELFWVAVHGYQAALVT
jgi:hypothetical protein